MMTATGGFQDESTVDGCLNAHRRLPIDNDVEQPSRTHTSTKGYADAQVRISKIFGLDDTLPRRNSRRNLVRAKSDRSLNRSAGRRLSLFRSSSQKSLNRQKQISKPPKRHRSRSMEFVPVVAHKQQHRSRSMDFVAALHPIDRKRMSTVIGLDAMKGVTLNLAPPTSKMLLPPRKPGSAITSDTLVEGVSEDSSDDEGQRRPRTTLNMMTSDGDMSVCLAPARDDPVLHLKTNRRGSNSSCVSELSFQDLEAPSDIEYQSEHLGLPRSMRDKKSLILSERLSESSPNHPHPALEYPPLYFAIRQFPWLLKVTQGFFRFRWRISYPLQRRIPLTRAIFRKMNVFVTVGELLLMLPFFATIVVCIIYSFIYPSVSISGHAARTPLIFCFVTAMKNSFLTLLLGIPFERALWYHKLSARLAYVCGLMHTYVAFFHPIMIEDMLAPPHTYEGSNPSFGRFLFSDQTNNAGTMLIVFMTLMMLTAIPYIRRKVFEVFYYLHVIFAASMIACAFFHTGPLVPALGALTWGVDLSIRKFGMALCRYPRKASLRIISDSVVELCFPKTEGFDYNPGQYVYLAIPELSFFEWHPFSLSSSPEQKVVTLHIRKAGSWTSSLYDLAKKKMEVSILLEGPYGSVGVDLTSDRYKMVMLFSGGIGVTPMQALCNQLMYEQSTAQRELKKLSFIWIERDPNVMQKVDVVRRRSCARLDMPPPDEDNKSPGPRPLEDGKPQGIASTLLSLVPASGITDEQLEAQYPSTDFDDFDEDDIVDLLTDDGSIATMFSSLNKGLRKESPAERPAGFAFSPDDDTIDQSFLDAAYNTDSGSDDEPHQALDLQVYLTNRTVIGGVAHLPFVHLGRPDVKELFRKMREEAIAKGEHRVAVCVCAPKRLVSICQMACSKFSDRKVRFDFHSEVFG
jgi:predicted ferric reductase